MRRCGEVRVVWSEGYAVLGVVRDFLALLVCLGFTGFLLLFVAGGW